ncbi:hypothetical protein BH11PSE10_BH11PSE10_05330 [soil metagenome]
MFAARQVIFDLGYRGVDADNPGVEIIHRCKYKTLTALQRRWLKRCQAIEPLIGHTKSDHRMDRCWLKGAIGGALHALRCAAGYNIRSLLRAITAQAAKAVKAAFLVLTKWTLYGLSSVLAVLIGLRELLRTMDGTLSSALAGQLLALQPSSTLADARK